MFIGDDFIPDYECYSEEEEEEAYFEALIEEKKQREQDLSWLYEDDDPYANEIWKPIPGYEGLYEVSNMGRVKSLERDVPTLNKKPIHKPEKILEPNFIGNNRGIVGLCKNGKVQTKIISRLVAEAFIPNPENKPCVDHFDTNYMNNKVDNLSWVTNKENSNNPLTLYHQSIARRGISHPNKRTITEEEKERMRQRFKGIPLSEEHKKKLSESHKGLKISKEPLEKQLYIKHQNGQIHLQEDENGNLIYKNGIIDISKYT